MKSLSIYDEHPIFASDHFLLRLVKLDDAGDLLLCYSDQAAVRLMNSDNCTSDFFYTSMDEMEDCIRGWMDGYQRRIIVRLSIIDRQGSKAIGTIEMHGKTRNTGVLRLDLRSAYETQNNILELLRLSIPAFYEALDVRRILIKSIPAALERITALRAYGFTPAEDHAMKPHCDYYVHARRP